MPKELSEAEEEQRDAVAEKLTEAGWKPTGSEQYAASLEYRNDTLALQVNYFADRRAAEMMVHLLAADAPFPYGFSLYFACSEDLDDVLDSIVAFQDELSRENYKEHVRALLQVCSETYAVDEEGDLARLTDETADDL